MIILNIVNRRLSTDPFAEIFTNSPILVSKSCQAFLLAAVGHLIFLTAVQVSVTSARRDWARRCASRSCTYSISLGETPARCVWVCFFLTWLFILAWLIFKRHIFLHIFPHGHIEFDYCLFKAVFVTIWSFSLEFLRCSPLLGMSWGYVTVMDSVALIFPQARLLAQTYAFCGLFSL